MNKFIILIILAVLVFLMFSLSSKEEQLEVHFLDVGQGDAILIRTPQGQNILIDAGPDNLVLSELAKVLPWWDRKIDYVIISHYHADHYIGLVDILNKYQVGHILTTAHQPDDWFYDFYQGELFRHQLTETIVEAGEKFILADDLYWQVLLADSHHEDFNDSSLVTRFTYGQVDFLFMGDLPASGEEHILQQNLILESEFLKIGHHGSKYSSSQGFLQTVNPKVCIIQSGLDNKFGHPHAEAIQRMGQVGCQIRDTQNQGTISLFSDGKIIY